MDLIIPFGSVLQLVTSHPAWDYRQRCELLYFCLSSGTQSYSMEGFGGKGGKKEVCTVAD